MENTTWEEDFDGKFFERHDGVLAIKRHNDAVSAPEMKYSIKNLLEAQKTQLEAVWRAKVEGLRDEQEYRSETSKLLQIERNQTISQVLALLSPGEIH